MGFERFEPVERRIEIASRPVSVWRPPDMESLIDLSSFEDVVETIQRVACEKHNMMIMKRLVG